MDELRVGDELTLRVGIHPKIGEPCFVPHFYSWDDMVNGEGRESSIRSIRLFNLLPCRNGYEFQDGEDWQVRVTGIDVASPEKLTKDGRRYVFVEVEVVGRVEEERSYLDETKKCVVKVVSGDRVVSTKVLSITAVKKVCYLYEVGGLVRVVEFDECYSEREFLGRRFVRDMKAEEYVIGVIRSLNGISSRAREIAQRKLEEMPEVTYAELRKMRG